MLELVILVGLQGAGKSTFYRERFAATHVLVSKDLLRNNRHPARRQAHLVTAALQAGRCVVVDNTNPTRANRAELLTLGRAQGARVVVYFFDIPPELCAARNAQRTGKARVPDVGLRATARRLEQPGVDEGLDELWVVRALPPAGVQVTRAG